MQAFKTNNDFLILSLVNLGVTNGFKCFLIAEKNSLIIIDAILSTMP